MSTNASNEHSDVKLPVGAESGAEPAASGPVSNTAQFASNRGQTQRRLGPLAICLALCGGAFVIAIGILVSRFPQLQVSSSKPPPVPLLVTPTQVPFSTDLKPSTAPSRINRGNFVRSS